MFFSGIAGARTDIKKRMMDFIRENVNRLLLIISGDRFFAFVMLLLIYDYKFNSPVWSFTLSISSIFWFEYIMKSISHNVYFTCLFLLLIFLSYIYIIIILPVFQLAILFSIGFIIHVAIEFFNCFTLTF